jgi:hypothetical protein
MRTFKEVRASFWNAHPQFKSEYRKTYTQNQYRVDIRCAWVEWLEYLYKVDEIKEKLYYRVTL